MSVVNLHTLGQSVEQAPKVVCHSYCYQCRITTAWKITKITSSGQSNRFAVMSHNSDHRLSCSECFSPLDLSEHQSNEINLALAKHDSIQGTAIHHELNHRIEKRQQACQIATQGNWLTAS